MPGPRPARAVLGPGRPGRPGHRRLPAPDAADDESGDDDDEIDDDQDEDDEEPVDDGTVWGEYPVPEWVCTDPVTHGHHRRVVSTSRGQARLTRAEMTPDQADAARAQRRDVIESNKAWGSAVVMRRVWVQALLTSLVDCTTTARR